MISDLKEQEFDPNDLHVKVFIQVTFFSFDRGMANKKTDSIPRTLPRLSSRTNHVLCTKIRFSLRAWSFYKDGHAPAYQICFCH